MGNPNWAILERQQIADLFESVGPDAPTLCGDWTTRDLAAHLIVRESRPDAAVGIVIKPLSGWGDRVLRGVAERPWTELVEDVRTGPPKLSAFGMPGVDRLLNTTEYFIHLEDVRRAQPDWDHTGRDIDPLFSESMWTMLKSRGPLFFRNAKVGVLLKRTDGRGGQTQVYPGLDRVTLEGPAQELLLYAYGRKDHALVAISGSDEAKDKLAAAKMAV